MLVKSTCFLIILQAIYGVSGRQVNFPTLPPVFQLYMQGSYLESTSAVEGHIYYDSLNNMAALKVVGNNSRKSSIYDFPYNQILEITGTNCKVLPIPENSSQSFFPFDKNLTKKTLQKPEKFFHLDGSNVTYLGQDIVRGTLTDVWQSTKAFPDQNLDCELLHFFTNKSWDTETCIENHCIPVPWRMNVTCQGIDPDGQTKIVDHIYDFFAFIPFIADSNHFLQPEGIFCEGKKPDNPFPNLADSYKFEMESETTTSPENPVFTEAFKLWFYEEEKLMRVEFNKADLRKSQLVTINDLDTKLKFEFDYTGYCKMKMDPEMSSDPLSLLGIKSPDEEAQYAGKRAQNGKIYDVWSIARTSEDDTRKEAYFLQEVISDGPNVDIKMVPTLVKTFSISSGKVAETSSSRIYNYRINPNEWDVMDISLCFPKANKTRFQLMVDGQLYSAQNFISSLRAKLLEIMAITPIRLDGIQIVDFEEEATVVMATVIDDPMLANGSAVKDSTPTAREAYNALQVAVNSNAIQFEEDTEEGSQTHHVTKIKISGMPGHRKEKPLSPEFSQAQMIGLITSFGALGLFIGALWLILYVRMNKLKAKGLLADQDDSEET